MVFRSPYGSKEQKERSARRVPRLTAQRRALLEDVVTIGEEATAKKLRLKRRGLQPSLWKLANALAVSKRNPPLNLVEYFKEIYALYKQMYETGQIDPKQEAQDREQEFLEIFKTLTMTQQQRWLIKLRLFQSLRHRKRKKNKKREPEPEA